MREFYIPTVRELLDQAAEKYSNSTFIKYIKNGNIEEKSFIDIQQNSKAVCRWLRNLSDSKIHIAIIGKTSYEYLTFLTGVMLSNNVGIPFSPEISAEEAQNLFERADITMLLYDNDFAEKAEQLKQKCPSLTHIQNIENEEEVKRIYNDFSDNSPFAGLSEFEIDKDDCIAMIFTSGTTGVRKGVMLSTNSLVGNIMYNDYCEDIFNEGDVALSVLPMFHVYCFTGDFLKNLKDGLQVCLNGNLRNITSNLLIFQPKVIRIVPMIAQSLLQRIKMIQLRNPDLTPREAAEKVYGKNIKWLISGGAYLPPNLIDEYDKFGIYLRQGYGMTEAGCRISVPDENVAKDSVGRVIDICDVRVKDSEIQVKTPTAMLGYYKMPEKTKAKFTDDGWLRTGDMGNVTEDNQLFITGRIKNLIILSSGENVSPEAIEKKFHHNKLIEEIKVYAENNQVVAEFYPDFDFAKRNKIENIKKEIEDFVDKINETAKASHIISRTKFRDKPFEKTATGKIKRSRTVI